ncbi:MAG: nuclear transport factor 2 family protein [Saprospiraceae bacterium]
MNTLIKKFYTAFDNLDADTMVSCYHPEIVFSDSAFGELRGDRAKNMWYMLCHSQKDKKFIVTFSNIEADTTTGQADWTADYIFSQTNRKVHNKISATFKFKDGLIIEHRDNFNVHKWAKQAMGFKGLVLGGTGFFKNKLNIQTNKLLDRFIASQNK